ncbi:Holliday junction branch migration protein RuvA [Candidatus Mycoplasma haematominutum]|uniref:Holliday junction branch migration protein RuvA n=1 Tax=Candidatus Mycoplasma haematominutum TaxID=209446 RepID=UPI0002FF40D7|nr:Holliday junction branch migration protein RuvA [Candidatus Mycoplasma haematominutum]
MYYLKCKVIEIHPSYVIAEASNVAYRINFINASSLAEGEETVIYIFQEFRLELKNQINTNLYGFLTKEEIEIFHFLITLKGIGCKTAQTILSNDLYQLSTFISRKDNLSLSKLKGLNWTLANSLLLEVAQSKNIRNVFISLNQALQSRNSQNEVKVCSWNENEVINSLIDIGYEWDSIKKALDDLRAENLTFPDNNAVINKCLQTISQFRNLQ